MKSYIPDYPRPQLVREAWENLNGTWRFAFDDDKTGLKKGYMDNLPGDKTITVPFTYETKLSGIGDETMHECVWYSRTFSVDEKKLTDGRLMLHFEGCDYITDVWVNGIHMGSHTGGYARFSFDISHAAIPGENTVTVMARDSFDNRQPRGKQRWTSQSYGCWYVQTTGIWKPVWLEYLPAHSISHIKLTPNIHKYEIDIEYSVDGISDDLTFEAIVSFNDSFINRISVPVRKNDELVSINVYNTNEYEWGIHSWTPDNPNLYDLELRLIKNGQVIDRVLSYFGMREIRIDGSNILLNGRPLYQRLILDQGYWKDSHLTPPDEAALVQDIDSIKALGYNGLRKHQKIEDERFLYWCDVKGLLVWSEMAAAYRFSSEAAQSFMTQWGEIVMQNYNHPSIITWTPINESWGVPDIKTNRTEQHFTEAIYHFTKSLDPYRPVIVNDGWEHTISDIITLHDYVEKGSELFERYVNHCQDILDNKLYFNLFKSAFAGEFTYNGQPIIISEFGGIAFADNNEGWGYGNKVNSVDEFIKRFDDITTTVKRLPYCCGLCYTQITDVQQEINGLMDMDRRFKVDPSIIKEINEREIGVVNR